MQKDAAQVELDNAQAHLQSVLANVDTATKQLTGLYGDIKKAQAEFASVKDAHKVETRNLIETQRESANHIHKAQAHIDLADRTEAELATAQRKHAAKMLDLHKSIDSLLKEETRTKESTAFMKNQLSELVAKIDDAESVYELAQQELESVEDQVVSAKKDLAETTQLIDDTREDFRVDMIEAGKQLAAIKEQISTEQLSVGNAHKFLAEREASVVVSEDNIRIVQNRIRNIFAEHLPHLSPPQI